MWFLSLSFAPHLFGIFLYYFLIVVGHAEILKGWIQAYLRRIEQGWTQRILQQSGSGSARRHSGIFILFIFNPTWPQRMCRMCIYSSLLKACISKSSCALALNSLWYCLVDTGHARSGLKWCETETAENKQTCHTSKISLSANGCKGRGKQMNRSLKKKKKYNPSFPLLA